MQAPHVMQFSVILCVTASLQGASESIAPKSGPRFSSALSSTEHRKPFEIHFFDA